MIKWEKHPDPIFKPSGNLEWSRTHAQTPVVDTEYDDKWRVYYSTRGDNGKSSIGYFDVEPGNPSNVLYVHPDPILTKGKPGEFDDCGVMPTYVQHLGDGEKYLYYIGWAQKTTVPYHNSIGVAGLEEDGQWRKFPGPLTGSSMEDPFFQGTACILPNFEFNLYEIWYLSAVGWVKDTNGKMEPRYHIKHAFSSDGLHWTRKGRVAIELEGEAEGGIASAAVIKKNGRYMMWYCHRNTFGFRDSKENSYRIGYAESSNGRDWARKDDEVGIERSESGWDSMMMCYPYVIEYEGKLYMFFNGNGFGKEGIGYAVGEIGD
jgi:predicted GH43/DUF377 family glycosyl hydrolase